LESHRFKPPNSPGNPKERETIYSIKRLERRCKWWPGNYRKRGLKKANCKARGERKKSHTKRQRERGLGTQRSEETLKKERPLLKTPIQRLLWGADAGVV